MRRALLALALFTAAAPHAPAQAKGVDARIAGLVTALGDASNAQARSNAYMTLLREKPLAAIPLLVDALPRYDVQGQEYGLWVLSSFPLEESRAALHKLAGDRSALLEAGAATQLWRLGEHEMLEHIVKSFARKDTPLEARRAMLRRVYLVAEPRLSAAVRAWLAPETDPQLLEDALYHLLNVEDPEARAKVLELAATPGLPAGSRGACAAFLLALGEDAQGLALAETVSTDDGAALARLQRFLVRAPRLPEELVVAVARVAERASVPAYAQLAIGVLAQHAGAKQIPVLEKLLDSPNLLVAKAALEALQKRGVTLAHETLLRMLASQEGLRALAAADALRRADDLSGFGRVLEVLAAGGADKLEAVRVLAKFHRRASIPPLVDALEDPDAALRLAAEQGLYELLRSLFPYRRFEFAASGFLAQAAADQRAEGVRRIRAWCAANLKP
jgi:HEAT repeat protein